MTVLCKICEGEKIWPPPVWLMRQAGRYLPEYNDVRKKAGSFLDLCYTPEYASEVTLQPIRRFDFDAAIIFADILLISENMNFNLSFQEKIGPIIQPNLRESNLLNKPISIENSKLMNVMDSIKLTRARLLKEKSLIGFCGAPWTVLSYLINGTSQSDFKQTIDWMEQNPITANETLNILAELSIDYLGLQIQAGADVVKIFDSWAGVLNQEQFENWVIKPTKKITLSLKKTYPNTPIIGFPKGSTNFYKSFVDQTNVDIIALDHTFDRIKAVETLQENVVLQGNISPEILLKGGKILEEDIIENIEIFRNHPFIIGLGHGILKETPPENVIKLVEIIRSHK